MTSNSPQYSNRQNVRQSYHSPTQNLQYPTTTLLPKSPSYSNSNAVVSTKNLLTSGVNSPSINNKKVVNSQVKPKSPEMIIKGKSP